MDSGKFSSAAVNGLLKKAGANRAIPEFRCSIQHLVIGGSHQGFPGSEDGPEVRPNGYGDEERAGFDGEPLTAL
jgi:hypothetical protein